MIIGIAGFAQHGKNFYAQNLEKRGFIKRALADRIREVASLMYGWTEDRMDGPLKEQIDPKIGLSFRQFATVFGTEFSQYMLSKLYPSYKEVTGRKVWINNLKNWIESQRKQGNFDFVIPDVRFPHEVSGIHELGGYVIRIVRPSMMKNFRLHWWQLWKKKVHESETHILNLDVDWDILNQEDSEETVEQKINEFLQSILSKEKGIQMFMRGKNAGTTIYYTKT